MNLASLRGKVVVVNFWQSDCLPCKQEAKTLDAAARAWSSKGVVFLGSRRARLQGPARAYLKRYGVSYLNVRDASGGTYPGWGVTGTPETFFIDRRGNVVPPHIVSVRVARRSSTTASAGAQLVRALAVVAAALALAAPAAACTSSTRASRISRRCSSASSATRRSTSRTPRSRTQMKADVARRIAACQTEQQILDAMVAQFGTAVLSTPQTHGFDLIAWLLPLGGIALGAAAIAGGAWHWSRKRGAGRRGAATGAGARPGRRTRSSTTRSRGSMIEKLPIAFARRARSPS